MPNLVITGVGCGMRLEAVSTLEEWLNAVDLMTRPLFLSLREGGGTSATALSTKSVADIAKGGTDRASVSAKLFSAHILRPGFLTSTT